ncbi:MAG: Z1 domain-containing protein [Gammaproteobacteria bacterium]|nr:Z1 domain-containing protein [Gammaproteobacteria bacterium]
MNTNQVKSEKSFTSGVIMLSALENAPTRARVQEIAESTATIVGYQGNLDTVIEEVMIAVQTRMGEGISLVNQEARHDEDWVSRRENVVWKYTEAYEKFLKSEGWYPNVVQSLSDVGSKILGHLQDPESEGSWDRRGLVIGHVQSGKTANYMGVIAKAADVGYKFIIVIAGIHNNLRKQTQERIDEGFVGRSSDPENRISIGVGLEHDYPHPATLTTIFDDFNKSTADRSGWKINDFSKPIILVIKKNVRTLEALHKWLKEMNAQGDGRISDVPVLMIDDEADNASINTNKPDLDPTRTNEMIRKILDLFAKSCYVGYTATPFANIFINPESYDEDISHDIFPRDFIYCLDAPTTYFGPDTVFLEENAGVTVPITDCEDYLPFSHKKNHEIFDLPPSLYRAIDQFIVARAVRNLRGHDNKHCSMMVNVSRFVNVQGTVRDFISVYEKKMREAVKANYAMPDPISDQNAQMQALRKVYTEEYADCGFGWTDVKDALWGVFDNLRLFVVNSKSDEKLDYRKYEKDGHGLTAIAVGGFSLSRGLTIEGLCISYMYRNTRMYDTLMQMGRWFGYRPGYEDLCQVYLSQDSIDWYGHIAEASEELRQQIKRMRRDNLSPRQFGLYVRAHPDCLMITAANKMRSGGKIKVRQNFSGKLLESYFLPTDDDINLRNEMLISDYLRKGFGGKTAAETEKGWFVKDVSVDVIEQFLTEFCTHEDYSPQKSAAVDYLDKLSGKYPSGDVLLVSVKGRKEYDRQCRLGTQKRTCERFEDMWRTAKYRVASRGDEKLGLTKTQQKKAESLAGDKKPSDVHFREVRDKPLLMIHILEIMEKDRPEEPKKHVPAFGISFPPGHYDTETEVVANTIWIDRMSGGFPDGLDDVEDYDE